MVKKHEHQDARAISGNISYIAGVLGLNKGETARVLGISPSSYYDHSARPWTFRIAELERLVEYATKHGMNVSLAQLLVPFAPGTVRPWGDCV